MKYDEKIICALDTQSEEDLERLLNDLKNDARFYKVGMELYYTFGRDLVRKLKDNNQKVFLDLKMHDIPNTVAKACKSLAILGADILNVHAAGGVEMMRAANEEIKTINPQAQLIAVTQLTSTSQEVMNSQMGIPGDVKDNVLKLALNARLAGLDGVVCSAHEVQDIKRNIGNDFKCITPGIRPKGSAGHDQKRIMTPLEAIKQGSDYLVIGRPITQANSPRDAYKNIIKELEDAYHS